MLAYSNRLRKKEFPQIKRKGRLYQEKNFGAVVLKVGKKENSKFGFVVSNKISKAAVHRNRIKRAFREAVRQNLSEVEKGYHILFLAKQSILKKTTNEIMKEVEHFLRKKRFR